MSVYFPDAGILALLEPILGQGIQMVWDGDKEGFMAVNPGPANNTGDAPSIDPSIAYSSGVFGEDPTAGAICRIACKSLKTIGSDECVNTYDVGGSILVTKYVGLRGFTLNLLLESDQLGFCQETLEKVRIKLQRKAVRAKLRDLAISIVEVMPVQDVSAKWDDRVINAATLDIECMMRVEDIDDTPNYGGVIETINNPWFSHPGPGPYYEIDGSPVGDGKIRGSTGELE